ncbi:hypothetical protein ACFL16_00880 [Patescibacteria group bacterium]
MKTKKPKFYPKGYEWKCPDCGEVVKAQSITSEETAKGIAKSRHRCPVNEKNDADECDSVN